METLCTSDEDYFSTEENGPFLFRSFEEVEQANEEHRYMLSYVDGFLRYRRLFFDDSVLILFQTALDEVSFAGSHIEDDLLVLHFTYHISDAIWPLFTRSYAFGLSLDHPISDVAYSMTNLFV